MRRAAVSQCAPLVASPAHDFAVGTSGTGELPARRHIHRAAHQLGIPTNATMLYGHLENAYHRIDHLIRLRELQDETGGFQTFIPLAFHPENTGLAHLDKPSSIQDLRTMAVSRGSSAVPPRGRSPRLRTDRS